MPNKHLVHVKSNETVTDGNVTSAKLPSASDLMHGELAVNYKTGDETISMKNDTNNIVKFVSENVVNAKQDVIDSSHKLSADLVDDTNTANKFVTAAEKQAWNDKQDALTFNTAPSSSNKVATMADVPSVPNNLVCFSNDSGDGIVPEDGIKAEAKTAGATLSINPDVVTVINGAVGTAAITLQVPNDNLAHVWDILMTTDSSVAITFAMSNSATILYPSGFSIGASKAVEVSVIGVGTKYYLRYGEFA